MKDSVRIKERNISHTTKVSFHKPDRVFVFLGGFKSASLTLKPVKVAVHSCWAGTQDPPTGLRVIAALLNKAENERLHPVKHINT